MLKKLIPVLLAGWAVWQWDARQRRLNAAALDPKPHDVTRWEEEGGALPDTGAQLKPAH